MYVKCTCKRDVCTSPFCSTRKAKLAAYVPNIFTIGFFFCIGALVYAVLRLADTAL